MILVGRHDRVALDDDKPAAPAGAAGAMTATDSDVEEWRERGRTRVDTTA